MNCSILIIPATARRHKSIITAHCAGAHPTSYLPSIQYQIHIYLQTYIHITMRWTLKTHLV